MGELKRMGKDLARSFRKAMAEPGAFHRVMGDKMPDDRRLPCQDHPVLSREDYLLAQRADTLTDGGVREMFNRNGHASWTCCPVCGFDDFIHSEGCELAEEGSDEDADKAKDTLFKGNPLGP
jgi:hypothetical protein